MPSKLKCPDCGKVPTPGIYVNGKIYCWRDAQKYMKHPLQPSIRKALERAPKRKPKKLSGKGSRPGRKSNSNGA